MGRTLEGAELGFVLAPFLSSEVVASQSSVV